MVTTTKATISNHSVRSRPPFIEPSLRDEHYPAIARDREGRATNCPNEAKVDDH